MNTPSTNNENENSLPKAQLLNTRDVLNLSGIEMLTLEKLNKHKSPVVRYILYQEINQLVRQKKKDYSSTEDLFSNSLEEVNLSTSSFYNSLKNLEKRGLVKFNYNKEKKKKIDSVESTSITLEALNIITQQHLRSVIDDFAFLKELAQILLEKINLPKVDTLLLVWLNDIIDFKFMNLFKELAQEVSILSDKEIYEDLEKMGLKNFNFSNMYKKVIREPNDFFGTAFISGYLRNMNFYGLSRVDLLKELVRITKKNGVIVFYGREELPITQNFYADEMLRIYGLTVKERIFSEKDLEKDLTDAGIKKYEVFNYKGLIVALGWVP
ncbi:MAG: hypothetical protein ACFFAO_12090 [Candidatus Hermodarchaeota archaeon]